MHDGKSLIMPSLQTKYIFKSHYIRMIPEWEEFIAHTVSFLTVTWKLHQPMGENFISVTPSPTNIGQDCSHVIWTSFLSLAPRKLRLCSANHMPGYWSNLPCDWPSTAGAYSEQESKSGPWYSASDPRKWEYTLHMYVIGQGHYHETWDDIETGPGSRQSELIS